MPLAHVTRQFGVTQTKISPVTADLAAAATTYGTSIAIPGTQNVTVSATVDTKQLFGDNLFLDSDSVMKTLEVELDYAKVSLDVMVALFGGVVTDTGTTPAQTSSWTLTQPPVFGYVKLEARTIYNDVSSIPGDTHILFGKIKATAFPNIGFTNEDYSLQKIKFMCVPPLGTGSVWFSAVLNQTAVPIT